MALFFPYCIEEVFTAPSQSLLLTHIRLVHSCDPNFSIQCSAEGCLRTFSNFRTYQNHARSHDSRSFSDFCADCPRSSEAASDKFPNTSTNVPNIAEAKDMQAFSAKWILKTCETRCLTRKSTIGIVNDVSDMLQYVSQSLCDKIQAILTSNEIDPAILSQVKQVFDSPICSHFEGLTSFHQQLQFFKDHFVLIVSC